MNGSKKFVVSMSHPSEAGSFAEMGVLFELDDVSQRALTELQVHRRRFLHVHSILDNNIS
jgi:hypothetical protein